ncbi:hypothetical protein H0X09_01270 [Candidatus Saccharibacteria bacterium]|nr:hypothetical protein [Candidatus Saccharibacteria bacterium]
MSQVYGHRQPVRRRSSYYSHFMGILLALVIVIGLGVGFFFYDKYRNDNQKRPVSQARVTEVSSVLKTFRSGYFQFKDTGNWVLTQKESTESKFIYYKYRGLLVEHQLIVYVNQIPIPLYLAAGRALPVRIVNSDSFDVTSVSEPCGKSYEQGELPKVRSISINQATILCSPDTPLYSVVLAEIGGDYKLNLRRSDGSPAQLIITYRDLTLDPKQDTIKNIARSFQTL